MVGPRDDPHVVRLIGLRGADLAEGEQLPVRLPGRRLLDESLDVGETQDGRQRRARYSPVIALALPVGLAVVLEARHRRRRSRSIKSIEDERVEWNSWADAAVFRVAGREGDRRLIG